MAAELIVAPEAERDVAEAYAWYEDRRVGLGEDRDHTIEHYYSGAFFQRIIRGEEAFRSAEPGDAAAIESLRAARSRSLGYAVLVVVFDLTFEPVDRIDADQRAA